ncbi:hypothetical protein VaNZ11_011380 [Volvox africanus]|uniref:Uncharacterized protein n=1 Tax=Volvox africanus TaxID=51714 RepID=A0ABQ5SB54_9CHLO|nr:hypothetical protein VaNZ11_011380 [Volvox africanus]
MAPITRSKYRNSQVSGDSPSPDNLVDTAFSDLRPAVPTTTTTDDIIEASRLANDRSTNVASTVHGETRFCIDSIGKADVHLVGPGGNLDDLCRLQYDADGEPAAAHDHVHVHAHRRRADQPTVWQEFGNLALLVLLYLIQGVPLGLTLSALPFMLTSKLSLTQMGIFSMAAYPYSLKLLWSPIVDSLYSSRVGRRKSWIIPIQLITAYLLISHAEWIQDLYEQADVWTLTWVFALVVFLMATQDIAVDGWALTLLSPANMSYASTCQTVGQTTGIFTSFTIFMALQDADFCNTFIRSKKLLGSFFGSEPSDVGLVSLAGYLRFWGWTFVTVTAFITLLVRETEARVGAAEDDDLTAPLSTEDREILGLPPRGLTSRSSAASEGPRQRLRQQQPSAEESGGGAASGSGNTRSSRRGFTAVVSELSDAYLQLWRVARLPAVWRLTALLLTSRLGTMAAEAAASLKLIDKGVAKEALAFLVLFQFPLELLSALVAGRWAASHSPYWPYMTGYWLRLATAAATVAVTAVFPAGAASVEEHRIAFGGLSAVSLTTSFVSYLGFTAQGSFFNTISDPNMGGAYLTLLNTIANMGFMLPRTPLFWLMDKLTLARCAVISEGVVQVLPFSCPKKMLDMARGDNECVAAGGECSLASDGYYIVSVASLVLGGGLGLFYVRFVWGLMREPLTSWRAETGGGCRGDGRGVDAAAESAARKRE